MSAHCRCYCGCDRVDRQLDDATSSDLTCRLCNADRHITHHPNLTERMVDLEFAVRQLQAHAGIPVGQRKP